MNTAKACPHCGASLKDAAQGLCPRCLVELGIALQPSASRHRPSSAPAGQRPPGFGVPALPHRFGDYELLEQLACGGMGVVYKARQVSLNRVVALKMIRAGTFASPAEVKRFRAEAESAARLQHPNIVAVHEVGECEGQHFFSMDYVPGRTLAEIVREGPLPAKRAAAYVKTIAEAVHYAHQHGIVHRDLKPANILIDDSDAPQITDFGLAKRLPSAADLEAYTSDLTQSGQVLGSPNYLPPEQAEPKRGTIGPWSDVYALGAILYHLITGRPPFQAEAITLLLRQVVETEPVAPRLLNPAVPRDLATICLKCLEKQVIRRYATPDQLAAELGRFLEGAPIKARPASPCYKAWKWSRRRPALAGTLLALVLALLFGFSGILWQWEHARAGQLAARRMAYAADMNLLQASLNQGNLGMARFLLNAQLPGPGQPDLRGWEWRYAWQRCQGDEQVLLWQYSNSVTTLAFSANGKWLVVRNERGSISLWDWPARRPVREWQTQGLMHAMAMSPGEPWLAYGDQGDHQRPQVVVRNLDSLQEVARIPQSNTVQRLAFSSDGALLAVLDFQGTVTLHRLPTGEVVNQIRTECSFAAAQFGDLVFSPDSQTLAFGGGYAFSPHLWHWPSDKLARVQVPKGGAGAICLKFSPDGNYLAGSCGWSINQVCLWKMAGFWDSPPEQAVPLEWELAGHTFWVVDLAFGPDGKTLASASADQTIILWDWQHQQPLRRLRGNSHEVWALAFSPDGKDLVSGGRDGSVRVWNTSPPASESDLVQLPIPACMGGFAFHPDGNSIYVANKTNGTVSLWDLASLRQKQALGFITSSNLSVACAPSGRYLAVGDWHGGIRIWDLSTHSLVTDLTVEDGPALFLLSFSPGGETLSTTGLHLGSRHFYFKFWNAADWRPIPFPHSVPTNAEWMALSPDRQRLAVLERDGTVAWWELRRGRKEAQFKAHFSPRDGCLIFSPDSRLLAAATIDGSIALWDIRAAKCLANIRGNMNAVHGLAFSPDGKRLLSCGGGPSEVVRVLDISSYRPVAALPGPFDIYYGIAMSKDGNTVISAGYNGTVVIWRPPSWQQVRETQAARPNSW